MPADDILFLGGYSVPGDHRLRITWADGPPRMVLAGDITLANLATLTADLARAAHGAGQVHIDRAHQDLLSADPARETVTTVAGRWGFPNASRFAAQYRTAYGVIPSTPLRQGSQHPAEHGPGTAGRAGLTDRAYPADHPAAHLRRAMTGAGQEPQSLARTATAPHAEGRR